MPEGKAAPTASSTMTIESPHHVPPIRITGIGPWTSYENPQVLPDFTFDYPNNWMLGVDEGRTQRYWQVLIHGPRNATDTYSAMLTIRRMPVKASGGLYENLQALIAMRRKQYGAGRDLQVLKEGELQVGGVTTWRADSTYRVPPPAAGPDTPLTPVRTTLVQFALGEQLYEVIYSADEREYATYQAAFDHLLETLRFTPSKPAASP